MQGIKQHLPATGVGFLAGGVLPASLLFSIFATRADIKELEVTIAKEYSTKAETSTVIQEVNRKLDKLDHTMERIADKLDQKR